MTPTNVIPLAPPTLRIVTRAGASVQSQVLASTLRYAVKPTLAAWARFPLAPLPTALLDRVAGLRPRPRNTDIASVDLPHCRAEQVRSRTVDSDTRAILYLHGGAFLVCGLNTHRHLVSRISHAAEATVLNVEYRMLPKNPISTAIDDGIAGYRWLLDQGYESSQIVIAGDSAGGYLAFMVALAILERDLPSAGGIVALSPLTDLDPATKLAHANRNKCAVFPAVAVHALRTLIEHVEARVLAEVADATGGVGVASPVDADLEAMPPTLIQVGSEEILLPDAELMAMRLASSDVPCELQVWERQVHVFQAAAGWVPEGARATAEIGEFVRAVAPGAVRGRAQVV